MLNVRKLLERSMRKMSIAKRNHKIVEHLRQRFLERYNIEFERCNR